MIAVILSFAAGVLTTLSPCVLPILPVIVASSRSESRYGPLAMALGLTAAFTIVGLFIASLGAALHLDPSLTRSGGALLLGIAGLVLLIPKLQHWISTKLQPIATRAELLTQHLPPGMLGQFLLGAVLGIIWSPCSGPTLGAALALASQSKSFVRAALQMTFFGLGAALPLVAIGYLARGFVLKRRGGLILAGNRGKAVLGLMLLAVSLAILTGLDRRVEAVVLNHLPDAWVNLTTAL